MQGLEKIEKNGLTYYRSPQIGVPHGFSTRLGGVSLPLHLASMNMGRNLGDDPAAVDENYRRFCAVLGVGLETVVYTKQIHSASVLAVGRADIGGVYECDGFVTREHGVTLSVRTADCVPVVFWSPEGVAGVCHAGWRGTVAGIQQATVEKMKELGANPENLFVAVGAAIGKCCYEVGDDFVSEVRRSPCGGICVKYIDFSGEKPHADLIGMNLELLRRAGVKDENIAVSGECTCCRPDLFFSHRASMGKRGVMAAMISL